MVLLIGDAVIVVDRINGMLGRISDLGTYNRIIRLEYVFKNDLVDWFQIGGGTRAFLKP